MNLPSNRKLFFPYLMVNYPDRESFRRIFDLTVRHADLIEIGIPFSDPVADGPVIQEAGQQVLNAGLDPASVFQFLAGNRASVPIALMTYANPVLAFGLENYFRESARAGVSAVIVPDVPFEEAGPWRDAAASNGIAWISFVSLKTSEQRLQRICRKAEGFVYLVSVTGITGSAITAADTIRRQAQGIRRHTSVPPALGFGIKRPEDALPFLDCVDAFIVGSRLIQLVREDPSLAALERFYRDFRGVLA